MPENIIDKKGNQTLSQAEIDQKYATIIAKLLKYGHRRAKTYLQNFKMEHTHYYTAKFRNLNEVLIEIDYLNRTKQQRSDTLIENEK
jgi:hypothetical protein